MEFLSISRRDASRLSRLGGRYGSRIGLFGGLDMDLLCRSNEAVIKAKVLDTIARTGAQKGLAFGSGNSIPDCVPASGYLAMVNTVRKL